MKNLNKEEGLYNPRSYLESFQQKQLNLMNQMAQQEEKDDKKILKQKISDEYDLSGDLIIFESKTEKDKKEKVPTEKQKKTSSIRLKGRGR